MYVCVYVFMVYLQFVFFAVDDNRRDLLIEEDQYGGEYSRKYAHEDHPPWIYFHWIDDPSSENSHTAPNFGLIMNRISSHCSHNSSYCMRSMFVLMHKHHSAAHVGIGLHYPISPPSLILFILFHNSSCMYMMTTMVS